MSLHKSKGLTADLVIICSCVNGVIPSPDLKLSLNDRKRLLEEQRRLFYVGITRTTNILVISSFRFLPVKIARNMMPKVHIMRRWGNLMTRSSQFISELGPNAPKTINGDEIVN
ncbi:3'-5' exonuclease [Methanobacterium sp.]|uniref:3'-5' exonuclease n=1 Tax=Methanobacterium sp. TaxID=2164 RepID=UPI003A0FD057